VNDLTVNTSRGIGQWLTLLLSMIFRNQFSAGVIVQSVGGIMILLGATLAIWGRMTLGQAFTSTLSPKGLVTTGIYSKLRHPMYTGGVLFFFGFGLLLQSVVGLVLTGLLVIPLIVYSAKVEEREMCEKFGDEYIDYRENTAL
jgi:protein-S-isoprenylcysteine O-methyltransferase